MYDSSDMREFESQLSASLLRFWQDSAADRVVAWHDFFKDQLDLVREVRADCHNSDKLEQFDAYIAALQRAQRLFDTQINMVMRDLREGIAYRIRKEFKSEAGKRVATALEDSDPEGFPPDTVLSPKLHTPPMRLRKGITK